MQLIEMPKTYKEQLESLVIGESIAIEAEKRQLWANKVSAFHREKDKKDTRQFTIRTIRDTGEIRVWRFQ